MSFVTSHPKNSVHTVFIFKTNIKWRTFCLKKKGTRFIILEVLKKKKNWGEKKLPPSIHRGIEKHSHAPKLQQPEFVLQDPKLMFVVKVPKLN